MSRTNSPISDPEPNYSIPEPTPPVDPVEDEKVSFKLNKKYENVLKMWDDRLDSLKPQAAKPDGMSYEEYGMKNELYNLLVREVENFKEDINLAYELRRRQS